jgi:hypothetical protein
MAGVAMVRRPPRQVSRAPNDSTASARRARLVSVEDDNSTRTHRRITAVHGIPVVPETDDCAALQSQICELRRDIEPIKRLVRWALGAAAGAALAVGVFLYTRGFTEGGSAARFEAVQKSVDQLERDVRQLERHSSVVPAIRPDAISSIKDFP